MYLVKKSNIYLVFYKRTLRGYNITSLNIKKYCYETEFSILTLNTSVQTPNAPAPDPTPTSCKCKTCRVMLHVATVKLVILGGVLTVLYFDWIY